jgi:uncharacterized membrane protein
MTDIAAFHPQIVHFVVGTLIIGVIFRWISLTGKAAFTRPAAATLLIAGAAAAVAAAQSGSQAHEKAERMPGVRAAVQLHEDAGDWTRDVFLVVGGLEIVGLFLTRRDRWRRYVEIGSAVVGLAGVGALYKAAERGGALVYSYAGGVGLRTGNPDDVGRLLNAGLFNQAMLARSEHRNAEADSLISELARRNPASVDVQLVAAQSLMTDRKDAPAALAALDRIVVPDSQAFLRMRIAFTKADVYAASGMKDSARAVLTKLMAQNPDIPRIRQRLERLK